MRGAFGTGQHGTDGFDGAFIDLAVLLKLCEVVDEGEVQDGVRGGRSFTEAVEVIQRPMMCFPAESSQLRGFFFRANEAKHLVARADQFF